MLATEELREFLTDRKIYVFDPDTRKRVAEATYGSNGTVEMQHADGRRDHGNWGVENNSYWTRYAQFRDGTLNRFTLVPVDAETAQAYFEDGRRAYLQSQKDALPEA